MDHPFNELSLKMEKITRNILHIVKLHFHLVYNENDFAYSRFITHAQLLAKESFQIKWLKAVKRMF